MLHTQEDLLVVIDAEIADRSDGPQEELDGLAVMRVAVAAHKPLSFVYYSWLCDLVSAHTEINSI